MAIFKAPKITTVQRNLLVLQGSEVVYDVDQKAFYGGDGVSTGGFPIGANAGSIVERIELSPEDITNKYVTLASTPLLASAVIVTPEGGIAQAFGIDFIIIGNKISWSDLGLDGFLEETDVLVIQY
jgi:hypothetical protein